MTLASVEENIRKTIKSITKFEGDIASDAPFLETTSMSSLQTVQLTVALDSAYGIKFGMDPEDFEALESLQKLVELVEKKAVRGLE